MGDHVFLLSDEQVAHAMMWSWIADAMSRLSIALGKVAVISFILEVQKTTSRRWQRIFLFSIAITNASGP